MTARITPSDAPITQAMPRRNADYWRGYLDGRAHGVEVGYDRGFSARVEIEAEARARELLTEQADQFGAWAVREAEQRYGAAWASMFREAS